jgi:hypothetical protein
VKEIWLLAVARLTKSRRPEPKQGYSVYPRPVFGGEAEHPASEMPFNWKGNVVTGQPLGSRFEETGKLVCW